MNSMIVLFDQGTICIETLIMNMNIFQTPDGPVSLQIPGDLTEAQKEVQQHVPLPAPIQAEIHLCGCFEKKSTLHNL